MFALTLFMIKTTHNFNKVRNQFWAARLIWTSCPRLWTLQFTHVKGTLCWAFLPPFRPCPGLMTHFTLLWSGHCHRVFIGQRLPTTARQIRVRILYRCFRWHLSCLLYNYARMGTHLIWQGPMVLVQSSNAWMKIGCFRHYQQYVPFPGYELHLHLPEQGLACFSVSFSQIVSVLIPHWNVYNVDGFYSQEQRRSSSFSGI